MSAYSSQDFKALFRSILQRAIGPDKNFVKLQIKKHIRKEIKNEALKDALRELCSDEEYSDLDNWFPDEEDEKNEEKEIAFQAELKESLANLSIDDVIKAVRKSISTQKRCSRKGCDNFARNGGVCVRHGAQVILCSSEGCTNKALQGGVCMKHGAKVQRCSRKGCDNFAKQGGVCIKHGAKVAPRKRCTVEDCDNIAKQGGVCMKHGAKRRNVAVKDAQIMFRMEECALSMGQSWLPGNGADTRNCKNQAKQGGVCIRHGAKVAPTSNKAKGTGRKRKSQDNESDDDGEDYVNVTELVEIAARKQRKIPTIRR
eukprot:CAMPEP_0113394838 /NCGR_PEP_ID=MMETSP0013_2-20120614/12783_1 /TAXON_ID=2843 ORGANISM="Skeletonema costatum, Strain 1716" /NCGR_SAMPLE_ID=MMETSP0013_2 /ASSEMBLY_ACC=CAM_ASM_000158 /LENGTH=313 /DNA_ID=CAMNT_0000278827 /DNA_START=46 /DNA_END=988 /DNA_ORIENTATION=+ /assembly_acc=CAM_ASM_000158